MSVLLLLITAFHCICKLVLFHLLEMEMSALYSKSSLVRKKLILLLKYFPTFFPSLFLGEVCHCSFMMLCLYVFQLGVLLVACGMVSINM